MNSKKKSAWHNFLTAGLEPADSEIVTRAVVLNAFGMAFVPLSLLLALFYSHMGAPLLCYAALVAGLLGIGVILLLRWTRNILLSANMALFILWALLVVIRWHSGDLSAKGLVFLPWVWNAVLILLAIFLTGYKWGSIWACLVFLESGLMVALLRSGHEFQSLIPPHISSIYFFGFYLTGLLSILLFAFLFEKERSEARLRERSRLEMLADSRRYLENILDRLPVPTFVLDNQHRVVEWNRACQELTGVPAGDILGKKVWEGFSLDDEGSMADKLLDNPDVLYEKYSESIVSMTDSGSFSVDTLMPHLRGGVRAGIKAAPILDENGDVKGAIQIIEEIKTGGEEKLPGTTQPERYEDLPYPVFRVNPKGKISAWNRGCEMSFGFRADQVLGKNALSLVASACRREFRDAVVRILKGESVKSREWKYVGAKGKAVYTLSSAHPAPAPSGTGRECVILNTDITKLRMRLKKTAQHALENEEKFKKLKENYDLLKKNIATMIRRKNGS